MISAPFADMKYSKFVVVVWLSIFAPSPGNASGGAQPSGSGSQTISSADDFDWREIVPYLFSASALPGEQGIKTVLENSRVLRSYVVNEIRAECNPDKGRCAAKREGFTLEGEVHKRIDAIVEEEIFHQKTMEGVDYSLAGQRFPFSEIAAFKSEKHADAHYMLALTDRSYTAAQVQAKYGAPYDTDIFQVYSVFKYRLNSPDYTSKAIFEIDPVDGAVLKIAISLKARKSKHPSR
ncbi:MAG: hypothetical protein WCD47_23105 [Candidatus Sulfotelmatobacter sp.]